MHNAAHLFHIALSVIGLLLIGWALYFSSSSRFGIPNIHDMPYRDRLPYRILPSLACFIGSTLCFWPQASSADHFSGILRMVVIYMLAVGLLSPVDTYKGLAEVWRQRAARSNGVG